MNGNEGFLFVPAKGVTKRVSNGVCQECGAYVYYPGTHLNWHTENDKTILSKALAKLRRRDI